MTPRPAADIRADLEAIAPWKADGEISAADLARHFAVRAAERNERLLAVTGPRPDPQQISVMCAELAAAMALAALADPLSPPLWGARGFEVTSPGDLARLAATQIRDALEDGGSIGEWLWEFLGSETCERVRTLAAELDEAIAAQAAGPAKAPAQDGAAQST